MFFCFASLARGQIYTANLTASGSTCATAGACVSAPVGNAQGGATLQLDGTFSATVQFEGLGGGSTWQPLNVTPSNNTTAVTSATGTGIWQVNVAGFTSIRIRCSTYASGTVVATITISNQAAILNGGGGGGGGSGTVTSVTFTGDGTVESSTPSSAVTTSGTVTATLATAASHTVLGNATGSTAAPTYTASPVVTNLTVTGTCTGCGSGSSLTVGSTTVTGGTTPYLLFNNGGFLGNESFASLLVSPPAIGGTTPAAGTFSSLTVTGSTSGIEWQCQTAATPTSGYVGITPPSTCAGYGNYNLPALPSSAGILHAGAASANVSALTVSAVTPSDATGSTSGSGNFCLVTSCVMTTPNLGTPSAINLSNAASTSLPGAAIANAGVTATQLAAQYSKGSCTELWGGSGTSFAMTSGDDAISNNSCYNDSGVTRTITALKCRSDNASNSTVLTPTFGAAGTGTAILTGTVTCGNSYAYSATGTLNNTAWTTGTGIDPGMSTVGNATSIAMIVEYTF